VAVTHRPGVAGSAVSATGVAGSPTYSRGVPLVLTENVKLVLDGTSSQAAKLALWLPDGIATVKDVPAAVAGGAAGGPDRSGVA
jgi:hypothetical protein